MNITLVDLVTWLIVGALTGPLVGRLVTRGKKNGFGHLTNLGIGLVGALLGGILFSIIPVIRPLAAVSVNLEDLISAVLGALLFLLIVRVVQKRKAS